MFHHLPKSATIWGQNIQTHEPVQDISHANRRVSREEVARPITTAEKDILMGLDILL